MSTVSISAPALRATRLPAFTNRQENIEPATNEDFNGNFGNPDDTGMDFCQWLAAIRQLQQDPWEKKRTIASFAMLIFHSGVNGGESGTVSSLTKERIETISKAPGWNQNEQNILSLMKVHFATIKELSASNEPGICYEDVQNLFASKKKLKDAQRLAASTRGAKSGAATGLCLQVIFMLIALQAGIFISMALAIGGALVGGLLQPDSNGTVKTALAGMLWGLSAGSALGGAFAAKRAGEYFDFNLSVRVDKLRQDLKSLRFE